jgi:hypothetical protein
MKTILKFKLLLILVMISAGFFTACDSKDDLGTPDRLFRPVITETTTSVSWIRFKWDRFEGAKSYELILSVDSFATAMQTVTVDTTFYTFENLEYDTKYYLRIRSFGENNMESQFMEKIISTLKWPTKLKDPISSDYVDRSIRVRWVEEDYDRLEIYADKTNLVQTVELTVEDNTSGDNDEKSIIVRELEPSTAYIVRAYIGETFMGEMAYTTLAEQIFDGDYIDLRGLPADETYTQLTQAHFDEWAEQYPNGYTVVLDGGIRYEIGTVNFAVNFKMVTGLSLAGNAIIEHNGGIGIKASANVGFITIDNIIFTDHPRSLRDGDNFGGKYAIDVRGTNVDTRLGELNLIGCDIRYKRGLLRAQSAVVIDKILIENCVIDSMGGYGVTNADHAEAYFKDIIIRNSTIAHCEKIVVASKPVPTDRCNSVVMENLTVCYAPKGTGNYIIDYNNQALSGGITIKNCIFGAGWDSEIRGMRSSTNNISVDNSFRAGDMKWFMNASTGEPQNPIDDLQQMTETTDVLFADPQNVNFKVTHNTLVNKVGDPRWWK